MAFGAVADRFQESNRSRKARWLGHFIERHEVKSALVVGSTGLPGRVDWENLVEVSIARRVDWVVWSGLGVDGTRPYVCADGLALPFQDQSFDLVFSNAVIEHVGGEVAQRQFVAEHGRVGRTWVLTTPNLWFPVESHTRAIARHWSPAWRARQASFSRLLSRRALRAMTGRVHGSPMAPTFIAWGESNHSQGKA